MTPTELFDALHFHPLIVSECRERYEVGNYADAIFTAFKCLEVRVIKITGLDKSGPDLMAQAFGVSNGKPKIQISPMQSRYDKGEQEGFMHLLRGSMMCVRNPKAHGLIRQSDPHRTLEYLGMASLLLKRIDEPFEA